MSSNSSSSEASNPRRRRARLGVALIIAMIAAVLVPTAVSAQDDEGSKDDQGGGSAAASSLTEPTPVDLGHRVVTPSEGGGAAASGGAFYVQFAGALSGADQAAIEAAGVSIGQAVAGSTYLVRIPAGAADPLVQRGDFLGLAPAIAIDALSPALRSGDVPGYTVLANGDVRGTVEFFPNVSLADAMAAADAVGVSLPDRSGFLAGNRLNIEGSVAEITALAGFDGVLYISEGAAPNIEHNATARVVNQVPVGPGTGGTGVIMGIWDGGSVRSTHQDLTGRVTVNEGTLSNHATHVAGTIIGSGVGNAAALGLAPSVPTLQSYDFNGNVVTEMTNSEATQNIVATNNSWGTVAGREPGFCGTGWCGEGDFGLYNTTARDWDNMVIATDLITVKSSGNDRNDCGFQALDPDNCDGVLGLDGQYYDNISTHGNAKNVITVGAINDDGTTITSFSSAGPADDGRLKPDVVANGSGLTSTCSASDTNYCSMSGTSMSSPVVSGIVAQIHQQYTSVWGSDLPAELAKAAIINSAADLGRPGPDYLYGYGNVRGARARDNVGCCNRFQLDSVADGEDDIYTINAAGGTDLRVTLTWLDPAGVANSATNDIVNDLDLLLISPSGNKFYPWMGPGLANPTLNASRSGPNNIDTVEQVDVPGAEAGVWHVRVTGTSVPTGPQSYAIVSALSYSAPTGEQQVVPCSAPGNDNFASASTLSGTSPLTDTVDNSCATGQTGELPHDPTSPLAGAPFSSLWWQWTAPSTGPVTVDTEGTAVGVDTVLGVYTGTDVAALTIIGQDDDGGSGFLSKVDFVSTAGTTYMIAADGFDPDELGDVKINLTYTCPAPANDDLANAATLMSGSDTGTVNNSCATVEAGELPHDPTPAPGAPFHSVWWEWTAPGTGPATVDTEGSSISDTVLGVYTGTTVTGLTVIQKDDDGGSGFLSKVDFAAVAGTTYRFAIDGHNIGEIGDVTININQACTPAVPNDDLASAATLTGASDTDAGDTTCATAEAGEFYHDGSNTGTAGHSVWYQWTAPATGPATVDTEGAAFDTVLGVYTGATVGGLTIIGQDDDGGTGLLSKVDFVATAGTTYKIAVDGCCGGPASESGAYTVNITQSPPVLLCNGLAATHVVPPGGANFFGTAGNDVIVGTPGVDNVFGLGGDDTICGFGGDDNLNGGNGLDWISGGDDNDFVGGQGGVDTVMGDAGNDEVVGGIGDDLLFGGPGIDLMRGQGNNDTINGDGDVDVIFGGSGNDIINTGPGANRGFDCTPVWGAVYAACPVTGNGNNDTITGSAGNDELGGQNGLDTVNGGGGDDLLTGGLGADTLNGDTGNDTLQGQGSADTLNGGDDNDSLSGGAGAPDRCNGDAGVDSLADATCEIVTGVP